MDCHPYDLSFHCKFLLLAFASLSNGVGPSLFSIYMVVFACPFNPMSLPSEDVSTVLGPLW